MDLRNAQSDHKNDKIEDENRTNSSTFGKSDKKPSRCWRACVRRLIHAVVPWISNGSQNKREINDRTETNTETHPHTRTRVTLCKRVGFKLVIIFRPFFQMCVCVCNTGATTTIDDNAIKSNVLVVCWSTNCTSKMISDRIGLVGNIESCPTTAGSHN